MSTTTKSLDFKVSRKIIYDSSIDNGIENWTEDNLGIVSLGIQDYPSLYIEYSKSN
jgi:hypothetical protein